MKKKSIQRLLALLLTLSLMLPLSGCMSEQNQVTAFVNGQLNLIYKGEYSDSFLAMTNLTPSECQMLYDAGFNFEPTAFASDFAIDLSLVDEKVSQQILFLYKQIYQRSSFHVSFAGRNGDTYLVRVRIYPLDTLQQAKDHFTELVDAWQARSDAGEFKDMSGREYETLWANAVIDFVSSYVPRTRTLNSSHTVTIRVTKDKDGVYWIEHDSLRQIDVFVIE